MKLTLKLILVLCLFSSVAFAEEGDMGNGGIRCPKGQTTCLSAEEPPVKTDAEANQADSILTIIQKYLISIFE